jgi:hypothetical protein
MLISFSPGVYFMELTVAVKTNPSSSLAVGDGGRTNTGARGIAGGGLALSRFMLIDL